MPENAASRNENAEHAKSEDPFGPRGRLVVRVNDRSAVVGVIGLGYVGLPLAIESARAGYRTIGFDIDEAVVASVNRGESHVQDVQDEVLAAFVEKGSLTASGDLDRLSECDAILVCVPTPLNKIKDPDLSYVLTATDSIRGALRAGQLVVLESTTYPGTTREIVLPALERSGLTAGEDFFLCYSPERVDPGNIEWRTKNTPKVLGGMTRPCGEVGLALYHRIFDRVVPVGSTEAAELVKVYENTFRMINIALVNELAQICERLDVDVWEVIEAAATKPFGFMKFSPGPGLGGHCIPLDPHYLSWKMRSLAYRTRMIELASEINGEMPGFVVRKLIDALNDEGKAVRGSRVLILGVAYKRDVDDLRESPALEIMRLLRDKGAVIAYHDPYCPELQTPEAAAAGHAALRSVDLSKELLRRVDAVVIVTDHTPVNYRMIAEEASLVVDTRGVMRSRSGAARVVGLSGIEQDGHVARGGPVRSPASARLPAAATA